MKKGLSAMEVVAISIAIALVFIVVLAVFKKVLFP